MKLHIMIEIYLKYDNMHTNGIINVFICVNNHVNLCIKYMLSITAEIKSNRWTLVDTCTDLERPMKIKLHALRNVSSLHITGQNLRAPSSIEWIRLKCNILHPRI